MRVSVSVPATVTNLGSGFDALGLALSIHNRFTAEESKSGLKIDVFGEGQERLARNRTNFVYQVMEKVFRRARKFPRGLTLRLENDIPIGKGLGSSASCVVGGLVLANALVKPKLSQQELLDLAVKIEGHPDNILPAFVGGFTIAVLENGKLTFARHELNRGLRAVIVVPDGQILTAKARRVLPKTVPFKDAVFNLSRSALTVSALTAPDLNLLDVSMQDRLHEKYRRKLFPSISRYLEVMKNAGGKGSSVSGSGPTVITFAEENRTAERIAAKIRSELRRLRLKGNVLVASISSYGAKIS